MPFKSYNQQSCLPRTQLHHQIAIRTSLFTVLDRIGQHFEAFVLCAAFLLSVNLEIKCQNSGFIFGQFSALFTNSKLAES